MRSVVHGAAGPPSDDEMHDACGVFGIYAPGQDVSYLVYDGLYALQHRGQESAGIAVFDGELITVVLDAESAERRVRCLKARDRRTFSFVPKWDVREPRF